MTRRVKQRARAEGARALAARVLAEVEGSPRARSPDALARALSRHPKLDPRDRALATELVYGVLRWRRRLDWALAPFVRQGLAQLEPVARTLLRIGAYQLAFLDRIPGPVAVSATQDAARQLRAGRLTGLLNGVLRKVHDQPPPLPEGDDDAALAVRASLPEWIVAELRAAWPDAVEAEALALRDRAANTVRPTLSRGGAEACAKALAEDGFAAAPAAHGTLRVTGPGDPFSTKAFREGLFVPQDPASVAVVELLGEVRGRAVLDLCAGRGVKATALLDRGAEVLAVDLSANKLDSARRLARRLGLGDKLATLDADLTDASLELGQHEVVLVDAPCSGLGTVRRHPEIAWRRTPEDVRSLVDLQGRILATAARQVAPGGALVYAVCTFARAEGAPPPPPPGFVEDRRLDLRPSTGLDSFQAVRLHRV